MAKKKLPYDAEIEYLQGGASSYIDTGIIPTITPRVVLEIAMTSNIDADVFGFAENKVPSFIGNLDSYSSTTRVHSFRFYRYYSTSSKGNNLISTVERDNYAVWDMGHEVKCNGQTLATFQVESFANNTQVLNLLGGRSAQRNGTINIKIKWAKIYDGDTLMRDFIPVRVDNVGYMYDKVSKQLFGNAGMGSFILGNDK